MMNKKMDSHRILLTSPHLPLLLRILTAPVFPLHRRGAPRSSLPEASGSTEWALPMEKSAAPKIGPWPEELGLRSVWFRFFRPPEKDPGWDGSENKDTPLGKRMY